MFTAQQLREIMRANPFKPFRIHLTNGKTFDVPNHDSAFVGGSWIEVATRLDTHGFPEWSTRCAILHIAQIEDLQPA
jgi:hypothetical protein